MSKKLFENIENLGSYGKIALCTGIGAASIGLAYYLFSNDETP